MVTAVFGILNAKDISEMQTSGSLLMLNVVIAVLISEFSFTDELSKTSDGPRNTASSGQ